MVKETAVKKFRQLKINKLYRVTRHKGSVAAVVNDSKCSPQNSKSGKAQHVENEKKRLQVEDHAGVDKNQASFDTIDNQECVIKFVRFHSPSVCSVASAEDWEYLDDHSNSTKSTD